MSENTSHNKIEIKWADNRLWLTSSQTCFPDWGGKRNQAPICTDYPLVWVQCTIQNECNTVWIMTPATGFIANISRVGQLLNQMFCCLLNCASDTVRHTVKQYADVHYNVFFFFFFSNRDCNSVWNSLKRMEVHSHRQPVLYKPPVPMFLYGWACRLWPADTELGSLTPPGVLPISLLVILPSWAQPQVLQDFTLIRAHWIIIHSEHTGVEHEELRMLTTAVTQVYFAVKVTA